MKIKGLFLLLVFFQCACTPKDDFASVRKALIESEHLLKGSMYCLNEKNYLKAAQKVEKLIVNESDELNEYFKTKGIQKKEMISEVIVRSLCDFKTYHYDRDIEKLMNKQLEGVVEEKSKQMIRESLNIKSYRGDGISIKDRIPPKDQY